MVPPISGPPRLSIATVHGPPAGSGAGFWIYMVSRVSLKGLYGRVRLQGLYGRVVLGGDQIWRSGQSGGTTILGGR